MSARSCMGCLNLVNEKRDAGEASLFYLGYLLGLVGLTKFSEIFFDKYQYISGLRVSCAIKGRV